MAARVALVAAAVTALRAVLVGLLAQVRARSLRVWVLPAVTAVMVALPGLVVSVRPVRRARLGWIWVRAMVSVAAPAAVMVAAAVLVVAAVRPVRVG